MSDKCEKCGNKLTEEDLAVETGRVCGQCRTGNDRASSSTADSMYVVCAFCNKGFYVRYDTETPSVNCKYCGKAIDLSVGGETIVMEARSDSDIFIDDESVTASKLFKVSHDDSSLSSGEKIGGYRLGEIVNENLLGTVYKGEQINLKREVTLYVLAEKHSKDQVLVETFMDEARKSASLVHPNICRVFDVGVDNERYYLVSEYAKGISIEDRIREAKLLDFVEAAKFGAQIARTLSDADSMAGLMHYGLSPANIIDCGDGKARVMFFGINHTLFQQGKKLVNLDEPVAIFYSPEQIDGKIVDQRSDLYSLGVSLYCALTGTLPYNSSEIKQFLAGKGVPGLPDMKSLRKDIPDALLSIIESLINIVPEKRPSKGLEVAVLLEAFAQDYGKPSEVEDKKEPVKVSSMSGQVSGPISPERKRKYKRFPTDMEVKISSVDIDKDKQKAYIRRLKDISENGAFILSSTPLAIGTFVKMDFQVEETGNRVSVTGIVRWCDLTPGQEGMGIQFLEVSSRGKDKLPKLLDKKAANAAALQLISTALHKKILKFVIFHYGQEVKIEDIMKGTGASRVLFDRTMADFEKIGLVDVDGNNVFCNNPQSEELRTALERALNIYR